MSSVSRSETQKVFLQQFGVAVDGGAIDDVAATAKRLRYQGELSQWLGQALFEYGLIDGSDDFRTPLVRQQPARLVQLAYVLAIAEGWQLSIHVEDPAEVLRRAESMSGKSGDIQIIVQSLRRLLGVGDKTHKVLAAETPASQLSPALSPEIALPLEQKGPERTGEMSWFVRGDEGASDHVRFYELDWGMEQHFERRGESYLSTYGFAVLDKSFHQLHGQLVMSPPKAGDAYVIARDPRSDCAVVGRLPHVDRERFSNIAAHLHDRLTYKKGQPLPRYLWSNAMIMGIKYKLKKGLQEGRLSPYDVELRRMVRYFWDEEMFLSGAETCMLMMSGDPGPTGFGAFPADGHALLSAAIAARLHIDALGMAAADWNGSPAMPPVMYDGALRALRLSDAILRRPRRQHDLAPHAVRLMDEALEAAQAKPRGHTFEIAFRNYFLALAGGALATNGDEFRAVIKRAQRCPLGDEKRALQSLERKYRRLHTEIFGALSQSGTPQAGSGGEDAGFPPGALATGVASAAACAGCVQTVVMPAVL
jgi:hypothetical protein